MNAIQTKTVRLKFPTPITQTDLNEISIQVDVINSPVISDVAFKAASEYLGERKAEALCEELNAEFNRQLIIQQII